MTKIASGKWSENGQIKDLMVFLSAGLQFSSKPCAGSTTIDYPFHIEKFIIFIPQCIFSW